MPSSGSARWGWAGTPRRRPSSSNCWRCPRPRSMRRWSSTTPRTGPTRCACSSPPSPPVNSRPGPTGSSRRAGRRARCVTNPSIRRATSACAPTAIGGIWPSPTMNPTHSDCEALRRGELTVIGRIRSASNATFLCEAHLDELTVHCVYKPIAGEAPLWDFPHGTLAGRELGAYLVSVALGWNIVPYTIIRDGPAGRGMLQQWVDQPGSSLGEVGDKPASGPDLVDLLPAGHIPPGYLPVLQAYDYA